jgi:hypothetical protein
LGYQLPAFVRFLQLQKIEPPTTLMTTGVAP